MTQPRDPSHPLYKLIDELLESGDQKVIALELDVRPGLVSRVKRGQARSARIWRKLIDTARQRKKDQERIIKELAA